MDVTTRSLEEFNEAARRFAENLSPRQGGATLVTLSGELGAGKTAFAQEIAKNMGVAEAVTSPTFVLEKIYRLENQKFDHLVHIDAYRLKGAYELEVLDWKELLADPGNLIVLEWPERVAEAMPETAIRIRFDIEGDERKITIDGPKENKSEE